MYNPPETIDDVNFSARKTMGIDAGFGSSAFGIVITQMADRQIPVLEALEYHTPDFNDVLRKIWDLLKNMVEV